MSSGSKKVTVGYWYRMLFGYGWCKGPIDAFLELRGGGRTAWKGVVTQTSRIYVNALNLWGGEKKEGGLQGYFDVQLGEADQGVNDYLQTRLGRDQPTYRGKAIGVWRGGRYGAMNPYPKRLEFKVRRILRGWDGDECWYAEKASVPLAFPSAGIVIALDRSGSMQDVTPNGRTRMQNAKTAVSLVLDYIAGRISPNVQIDLHGVGWAHNAQTITRSNVSAAGVGDIRSFFNGMAANGSQTDFAYATASAKTFFASVPATSRKIFIFITDGEPSREGLPFPLPSDAATDLCRAAAAALFSSPEVQAFGFNIDLPDTRWTSFLDNTANDGVPVISGSNPEALRNAVVAALDGLLGMNGAHVLYDSLTASDMQSEPVAMINEPSFTEAADRLYNEGVGLCTTYDPDTETIEEFQQRICNVIGASLTQSRINGQYYLDLVRDDDAEGLPIITANDIIELKWEPVPLTELVNQITVEWFDPERKEHRSTPPVQSLGAIQAAGRVIPEVMRYPEIAAEGLALRVAARDLQARSTPLTRFTLTTNRRRSIWALRPGQRFRLQSPQDGFADIICVLGDIDVGTLTSGRIAIKAVQDVFGMPDTVYVEAESGQAPPQNLPPAASPHQRLIEAPYVELVANMSSSELAAFPDDAGAIMAMASQPLSGLNYSLWSGPEGTELEDNGSGDWCPVARIVEEADYLDTEFTLTAGSNLDDVVVGSWALWDEEIVRVDAIDRDALRLTIGRGCADTVPHKHDANSLIYFCGDWGTTDDVQYVDGETVTAKLRTRTSNAELSIEETTELRVEMLQRQFRPYPPGNLRINGQAYPNQVVADPRIIISWAHRDRLMQADKLLDATAADIGPEPGISYQLSCYLNNALDDSVELTDTSYTWAPSIDAGSARVELHTVREGMASQHRLIHQFDLPGQLWDPLDLLYPPRILLDDESPLTLVAEAIGEWSDRSGNGFHFTQSVAARRPVSIGEALSGRRIVRFDGSNDWLVCTVTGNRSIFRNQTYGWALAVVKKRSLDTGASCKLFRVDAGNGGFTRLSWEIGTPDISPGANRHALGVRRVDGDPFSIIAASEPVDTEFHVALVVQDWSTGTGYIFEDGVLISEGLTTSAGATSNTDSSRDFVLGVHPQGLGTTINFDLAAFVVGTSELSPDDIDRMTGWASWRFGLQDNLPGDHPYKSAPPLL